jgi:hypothetical protein
MLDMVVCAYNPSYLGGRDQKDSIPRPALGNMQDLI